MIAEKCAMFENAKKLLESLGVIDSSLLIPVERYPQMVLALLFLEEHSTLLPSNMEERSGRQK